MIDWRIMHKHMMNAVIKLEDENRELKDHIQELNNIIETLKDIIIEYESELLEE